jgi:hypothetical protein
MNQPVRENPQGQDIHVSVVSDHAVIAIIFLHPVEKSLGERHDCCGEPNDSGRRPPFYVDKIEVHKIECNFDQVYEGYFFQRCLVNDWQELCERGRPWAFVKPSPAS